MIESIKIRNYQSHRLSILNLSGGVNVITGISQSGKTAILRALNWVINNRPSGSRYINQFAKDKSTSVEIVVDGDTIRRKRTGRFNGYELTHRETKTAYSGMSTAVPDKIVELLNISDLNIQHQLDVPFLITDSAGKISKTINRVTKLEKADEWVTAITRQLNSATNRKLQTQKSIDELESNLDLYYGLEKIEEIVENIEDLDIEIQKIDENVNDLNYARQTILKNKKAVKLWDRYKEVEDTIDHIEEIDEEIREINVSIADLDGASLHRRKMIETKRQLDDLLGSYIAELEDAQTCPVCFGNIDEDCIQRIERDLLK